MPIYEYRCTNCDHDFQKLMKLNEEKPPCPECKSPVKKLISQGSFQLMGSGWYKDGYGLHKGKKRGK